MNHWFSGLGMYWWVIVVALLIVAGLFLAARMPSPRLPAGKAEYELLRRRYAAGEIDDAEYERRLKRLDVT